MSTNSNFAGTMLPPEPFIMWFFRRMASTTLLRLVMGILAMVCKFSVWIVAAYRAGVAVPPFAPPRRGRNALMATGLAAECGGGGQAPSSAMADGGQAPSSAMADLVGLRDVFCESADGTRLHAVEDDGTRRAAGKRPLVFVHGFPEVTHSTLDLSPALPLSRTPPTPRARSCAGLGLLAPPAARLCRPWPPCSGAVSSRLRAL